MAEKSTIFFIFLQKSVPVFQKIDTILMEQLIIFERMVNLKKYICSLIIALIAISIPMCAMAAIDYSTDEKANQIESTHQDITLPSNITTLAVDKVKYDHNYGVEWPSGSKRYCWGQTQAKQGSTKITSYTRARFEYKWYQGGGYYCDSGRCWSKTTGGKSYAKSGTETYDALDSGVAKTYYGS